MKRLHILSLSVVFLLLACAGEGSDRRHLAIQEYNAKAYHYHYIDLDSARFYTQKVLDCADATETQHTEALNNLAFVLYEEMYYDSALNVLHQIQHTSRNQLELLCADVMSMKIAQRVGEGKEFFLHRNKAEQRIKRIREAEGSLPSHALARFHYALSEYHLVSATYFYYLGQDSLAIQQMDTLQPLMQVASDTAQWLYNNYMLGSGGLIEGSAHDVTVKEFDHLLRTLTVASMRGYRYFRANTLQSLATMMTDTLRLSYLQQDRRREMEYLFNQPICDTVALPIPLALASAAVSDFEAYGDIFQSACALRTMGEVNFLLGHYNQALENYLRALDYVERQADRSKQRLPQWMAGIRQQLSLTYSALGDSLHAADNRALYLSLIDSTSQNSELQSRREQLEQELNVNRTWLSVLLFILMLCIVLSIVFVYRSRKGARLHDSHFKDVRTWPLYQQYLAQCQQQYEELQDEVDEVQEEAAASRIKTQQLMEGHLERRAKVQMVYAIVPYLDRTIASVQRLLSHREMLAEPLQYANQLLEEIMRIQEHLTAWIQMSRGQIKLHISTFPLSDVFSIVEGGAKIFQHKGIQLDVQETHLQVKADRALTLFMVNTLADNARKFTEPGGKVTLSATQRDDYVEISVADTGIGLSEKDIQTINDTKVYDAKQIGRPDTEKGFGFGIMNCRGIIAQLRKTSARFQSCQFGCSAQEGGGTRFWFRLPYVGVLLAFLFTLQVSAARMDTLACLNALSDSAFVAQQQGDWAAYYRLNDAYLQLHHQYTADASLPIYCARMQQLSTDNRVLYALLVLSFLFFLCMFYMLFLRGHLRDRRAWNHLQAYLTHILSGGNPQEFALADLHRLQQHPQWWAAKEMVEQAYAEHQTHLAAFHRAFDDSTDTLRRQRYQEDRLYVSNQVLDNGLSTIKHETMYYPARALQMLHQVELSEEPMPTVNELFTLLTYYRHVYTLLYEQVQRQVDEVPIQRAAVQLQSLFLAHDWDSMQMPSCSVLGDAEQLTYFVALLWHIVPDITRREVKSEMVDGFLHTEVRYTTSSHPHDDVFSASSGETQFLIAKEIIRQHDNICNMPGLRLTYEAQADGFLLSFTLKICAARVSLPVN